jgi:hypothetical protein
VVVERAPAGVAGVARSDACLGRTENGDARGHRIHAEAVVGAHGSDDYKGFPLASHPLSLFGPIPVEPELHTEEEETAQPQARPGRRARR